jgi:hypothetical protein
MACRPARSKDMKPKEPRLDKVESEDSAESPDNQPLEWADEDIEIERRKPDLGEIEADESEL